MKSNLGDSIERSELNVANNCIGLELEIPNELEESGFVYRSCLILIEISNCLINF